MPLGFYFLDDVRILRRDVRQLLQKRLLLFGKLAHSHALRFRKRDEILTLDEQALADEAELAEMFEKLGCNRAVASVY